MCGHLLSPQRLLLLLVLVQLLLGALVPQAAADNCPFGSGATSTSGQPVGSDGDRFISSTLWREERTNGVVTNLTESR